MADDTVKVTELLEVRDDVRRALVDIWRGARLIRDGVDVTEAHKAHLQAVLANIDGKLATNEEAGSSSRAA